jgi:hypothetical protein
MFAACPQRRCDVKRYTLLVLFVAAIAVVSCTSHHLTKQMLLEQLTPPQNMRTNTLMLPLGSIPASVPIRYTSNGVGRLLCFNQKGEKVYLKVNGNMQLIVTDKAGKTYKFYFDTVYATDESLFGLRSRILGAENKINLEDIATIEVYTELSREERAQ